MKEITVNEYESFDGKIFKTKIECLEHEFFCKFSWHFSYIFNDDRILREISKAAFFNLSVFIDANEALKKIKEEEEK